MTQKKNFKEILEATLTNMTRTSVLQLSSMLGELDVLRSLDYHIVIEERQWDLIYRDNEDYFDYDDEEDCYWGLFFIRDFPVKYSVEVVGNSRTERGQMIFCPILRSDNREVRILFESKYN